MISVIIPCRNEEKYIGRCLDSIVGQDYPKDDLEILVVDGSSNDGTQEIVRDFSSKHSFIKLLQNPQKFTPFGLNVGIREARGEVIIRMDSHAGYEKDYISKCLKHLRESGADNVGGVIKTIPSRNTLAARAVAKVLSHPFGAGSSHFRIGSNNPKWVDTVFGGCYKRSVFSKIGLFDERLVRAQDIELNRRLIKAGGKILLAPDIVAYYFPQATFFGFWRHNFTDGVWVTYPLKFGIKIFSGRHLVPLGFVSLLFLGLFLKPLFVLALGSYVLANLYFSSRIALKEDLRFFFVLPLVFTNRHFGYGLGSMFGIIKIFYTQ